LLTMYLVACSTVVINGKKSHLKKLSFICRVEYGLKKNEIKCYSCIFFLKLTIIMKVGQHFFLGLGNHMLSHEEHAMTNTIHIRCQQHEVMPHQIPPRHRLSVQCPVSTIVTFSEIHSIPQRYGRP
jgi:hypothetical protein